MIPRIISKVMVNSGPPFVLWLFSHHHLDLYKYMEGEEWVNEHYDEVYFYEQGRCQTFATWMLYFHFLKKLMENMFLHRSAGRMTPVNRTIWQFLFYWVLLAAVVGYSLFHPVYRPILFQDIEVSNTESSKSAMFVWVLICAWFMCEILNFLCHFHFQNQANKMTVKYDNQLVGQLD